MHNRNEDIIPGTRSKLKQFHKQRTETTRNQKKEHVQEGAPRIEIRCAARRCKTTNDTQMQLPQMFPIAIANVRHGANHMRPG